MARSSVAHVDHERLLTCLLLRTASMPWPVQERSPKDTYVFLRDARGSLGLYESQSDMVVWKGYC